MFTVLRRGEGLADAQSKIDRVDIDILAQGFNSAGILEGGAVTAQPSPDLTLAVAAGSALLNHVPTEIVAGNVTITTPHPTLSRFDLVVVDSGGAKTVRAGPAAASPVSPTLTAGDVPLAAVYVPAGVSGIAAISVTDKRCPVQGPARILKTANQSVTSSTTLVNDTHLKMFIGANSTWLVRLRLLYQAITNGDIKFVWVRPSGTHQIMSRRYRETVTSNQGDTTCLFHTDDTVLTTGGIGGTSPAIAITHSIVKNGAIPGDLQLQWAQVTSNGTATTVLAGSAIEAWRVRE